MKVFVQRLIKRYDNFFHRYPKANLRIKKIPPKKFVIFLYSAHGDIALSSSLTQYIKNKYKPSQITFVTSDKCRYTTSLNPDIDKIITVKFPKFWTYKNVEEIEKKLDYDVFLNASFYPNLRYLIPFMPLIEVPFFLFKDRPVKLPTPRLRLNFKPSKEKYIVLNLEAGTFGWHENMIDNKQMEIIKKQIVAAHPQVKFIINKCYSQDNTRKNNVKIYDGNIKGLIKLLANASGVVSIRNGLCDVLAAATNIPQFVIYPEGNFPDNDGIPALKWATMVNLGYRASITESLINKNRSQSIKKNVDKINKFIKAYV